MTLECMCHRKFEILKTQKNAHTILSKISLMLNSGPRSSAFPPRMEILLGEMRRKPPRHGILPFS